ncbi:MAG: hypothetical protein KJ963_03040 [Bacteroidetes bacterium]|nr:hypothetical protein [Bacteroidota bacterium]MBU1421741.1 hypothetical protein [Bacteroidota bacterium]MBU2636050.1 hypothetical protein [Bacteroidota bacterium]
MNYKFLSILILTVIIASSADCQISTPNNVFIGFDKIVNTHRWDGTCLYKNIFSNLEIHIDEKFKSTLLRTNRNIIRDEQAIDIWGKYRLGRQLRSALKISSFLLSDNQTIGISEAFSNVIYGGFEFQPVDQLILEPYIGLKIDRQVNETDDGLSFLVNARTRNLELSGFKTLVDANFQKDNLNPRHLETHNAIISIEKRFFENTRNVLSFLYKKNCREFYFAADTSTKAQFNINNNIDKRIENAFAIFDTLDYNIGGGLQFSVNGVLALREIDRSVRYKTATSKFFDNNINDFKIEGSTQLTYNPSKRFYGTTQLYYGERDVVHSLKKSPETEMLITPAALKEEEKKNNNSRRTTLSANVIIDVTNSDRISFSGSGSILRYDTPSILNDDDRDELWMLFELNTYHKISQYLYLQNSINTNLTHVVYLLGSRSANNNWNRLWRLSPRLNYKPSKYFSTLNTFEVLANYTVFDFDDQFVNIKSFSFRQFSFIDSTNINLSSKVGFSWFNHIRLYERGEFNWTNFKGRPINYFEDKTYIAQLQYTADENLLFSVGIRYFSQTRYGYDKRTKHIETRLRSVGPLASLIWNIDKKSQLQIKGWHERVDFTDSKTTGSSNITMTLKLLI